MRLSFTLLLVITSLSLKANSINLKPGKQDTLTFDSLTHKTVFKLTNNNFSGEGWNLLTTEINKAHFVLIGEQHGEAEVPLFTGKVAEVLHPKALVVEVDPYTATELQRVSASPKLYRPVLHQNPYAFAFYSWQSEMDLVTRLTAKGAAIWGLNEINFLSMGTFFKTLAANAKLPTNKSTATKLTNEFIKNDQPLYRTGEFGKFAAFNLKESKVDSLIIQFKSENGVCKKMLNDLKISTPIFHNTSYLDRVNLMKKNLLNYVYTGISADAITMPKLLFKFGANHVTRTNDFTKNFEAGNLADNLAAAAGKKTLHILIFGKAGTINNMHVADNSKAVQPYDIATDKDLEMLSQFTNPVQGDEWAVYDLRPMRKAIIQGKYRPKHADIRGLVMGYDLLVTFAKVSGSRFIE